jgi:O-antigen/teichoic acid export membrane protein
MKKELNTRNNLFWTVGLKGLIKIASLLKTAILARVILKQQLGIFGISVIVLGLLETLTETGINTVLIQEKDGLNKYKDTAWTISIIRGVLISLLIFILAPWIASFFRESFAVNALRIFSLVALVRGFINPSSVRFQKELLFSREFYYRCSIAIFEATMMVIFGLAFHSAVSLAVAILCSAIFEVVLSLVVFLPRPKFKFIASLAQSIIRRGKWLNSFGIFAYIFSNADNIAVGRLLGSAPLGVYQYSYNVSTVPLWDLTDSFHKVIFPSLVQLETSGQKFRQLFMKSVVIQFLFSLTSGLLMILLARPLVLIVFGSGWLEAISLVRLLSVLGIIRGFANSFNSLFLAAGKVQYPASVAGLNSICMLALLVPLVNSMGSAGAAFSALIGSVVSLPLAIILAVKIFKNKLV